MTWRDRGGHLLFFVGRRRRRNRRGGRIDRRLIRLGRCLWSSRIDPWFVLLCGCVGGFY